MNNLAIAFLTKDKPDLSRRSIQPLIQPDKLDLYFIDGSVTEEGKSFPYQIMLEQPEREQGHHMFAHTNVRGGPDAAIVYALTIMLKGNYQYVGLCEQDVLLHLDWLGPTLALFARGAEEGLSVGAVSARAYEDRILMQRDGYAVMHNLGAGMVIFHRDAAAFILSHYRTGWWPDNRRIFNQLSGLDIGRWGAFKGNEQSITADWHFDTILASCGWVSLALTPCLAQMIGQPVPLEQQGLHLVKEPLELLRNDEAFETFRQRTSTSAWGDWNTTLVTPAAYEPNGGTFTHFPHHFSVLNARWSGKWAFRWSQGFGPFSYVAVESGATLELDVSGIVALMAGGGETGGQITIRDAVSGYHVSPTLLPESKQNGVMQLPIPCAGMSYRTLRVTANAPGITIFGLVTKELQPEHHACAFDYETLPPVWVPPERKLP